MAMGLGNSYGKNTAGSLNRVVSGWAGAVSGGNPIASYGIRNIGAGVSGGKQIKSASTLQKSPNTPSGRGLRSLSGKNIEDRRSWGQPAQFPNVPGSVSDDERESQMEFSRPVPMPNRSMPLMGRF